MRRHGGGKKQANSGRKVNFSLEGSLKRGRKKPGALRGGEVAGLVVFKGGAPVIEKRPKEGTARVAEGEECFCALYGGGRTPNWLRE